VAIGFVVTIVTGYGLLASFMVLYPQRVLRFVIAFSAQRTAPVEGLFEKLCGVPPYRWLLEGLSWSQVREAAMMHPDRLPRVLAAYRIVGAVGLVIASLLVVVVVGGIVISAT
jgi:hypothetical protein